MTEPRDRSLTHSLLGLLIASIQPNLALQIGLVLITTWFLWWQWRFNIEPRRHPNRAKTYPYWVPFIGHSVSFFRDGDGTVTNARQYFKNSREPFKLVIMGHPIYFVTSSHDAGLFHKQVESLSIDGWIKDLMEGFGASGQAIDAMLRPAMGSEEPLAHVCQLILRMQMNPVERHNDELQLGLLDVIRERLTWDAIPQSATLSETSSARTVSLLQWSQHVLLEAATKAFFGESLLEIEPGLLKSFCEFDDSSWKLSYRVPSMWAQDALRSKAFTEDALDRYFDLPAERRADCCWFIRSIEERMRASGIQGRDIGKLVLLFYWVINANAWKAAFWMLAFILNDSELHRLVVDEVAPVVLVAESTSTIEIASRLGECPTLLAVYHEVLRLTASSVSVRTVINPVLINNLALDVGARVVVPYHQMMVDESVFGPGPETFNYKRFLENSALAKSPSFKPFGGGTSLCPGRQLAQREVLLYVALALGKFRLSLGSGGKRQSGPPDIETTIPSIGIMGPVAGQDVHVTVSTV